MRGANTMKPLSHYVDLTKRGVSHLASGDISPIFQYILGEEAEYDVAIRNINQEFGWVDSDIYLLKTGSGDEQEYHRVFQDDSISINIDNCVSRIYFEIVDLREVPECTVNYKIENGSKEIREKQITIRNGEYYRSSVPIEINFDDQRYIETFKIEIEYGQSKSDSEVYIDEDEGWSKKEFGPVISFPEISTAPETHLPDIFLITVDTFRQDHISKLQNTIDSLGDDVKVPDYPQTQGVCTWPSHASIFTGVHPGTHKSQAKNASIFDQSLATIPEILEQRGYICSACVGKVVVSPQYGFGKGFHRFKLNSMSWSSRRNDAETNVQQVKEWLNKDRKNPNPNFYFMHLFDAHYPYYPPLPQSTLSQIDFDLKKRIPHPGDYRDYMELIKEDPLTISETDLSLIKKYYSLSLEYIDRQLDDLISAIKSDGEFENSLIIVAGDHGEDLYERKFMYHHSLYQPNINPGLMIKPPKDEGFKVPDRADLIDVFPTIYELVEGEQHSQSQGKSWMKEKESKLRITERFVDHYNVSVTQDPVKAIYTFEKNGHERPTESQLRSGPILEEYFSVTDGMSYEDYQPSEDTKSEMRDIAYEFIREDNSSAEYKEVSLSEEAQRRLEELGYKQ